MRTIIILLVLSGFLYSQTKVYEIPFGSKGNEIELTIENKSILELQNVKVKAIKLPSWIKFVNEEVTIKNLKGNEEALTTFKFEVEKEAPLKEKTKLAFQIENTKGESWNKEISISVQPPNKFELNQNYPNPFNPSTTISYTIPVPPQSSLSQREGVETLQSTSRQITTVQLKIYDILGREVATLVNKQQKPGYYKVEWNANNYASGMYIYSLAIKQTNGKQKVLRKKMILLR